MSGDRDSGCACVIVHHRNLERLGGTVKRILDQGIAPEDLIVVDNSEGAVADADLNEAAGAGVTVARVPNRGYGNAANHGLDLLLGRAEPPRHVLVATHEVEPRDGAVELLLGALRSDARLVAVGPTLVSVKPGGGGWITTGGDRSRLLGIPRHVTVDSLDGELPPRVPRLWLDGAFVVYSSAGLGDRRFREEFFMYYEETELHYRLGRTGGIECVTGAIVDEIANDVPPALQARNLQWLMDLHGTWLQRTFSAPWLLARTALKVAAGRAGREDLGRMFRGWRQAKSDPLRSDG